MRELKRVASEMDEDVEVTYCWGCKEMLPVAQFHRNSYRKTGFAPRCKPCRDPYHRRPTGRTTDPQVCSGCGVLKPATAYHSHPRAKNGLMGVCKECRDLKAKERREYNPQREKDKQLRTRYGISLADFNRIIEAQGGVCAICLEVPAGKRPWHVDHDHGCCPRSMTCGQCVRGVLCAHCNTGIGNLRDDPARLRRAADYVEANLPFRPPKDGIEAASHVA